jgi:hypothetical protein
VSYGFSVIEVLPEIIGKPWCDITQAYLRALRPSDVRVVVDGEEIKSDAKLWRVTVFLSAIRNPRTVTRVEQEVEVNLPPGVDHGVRVGSIVSTCKVFDVELLRSQSQFGGPAGFMVHLLSNLARSCIEQVEQNRTPMFAPIVSSVDMNMYKQLIDDINQGVMVQFAVPDDLLNSSTQTSAVSAAALRDFIGSARRVDPVPMAVPETRLLGPGEPEDEPRKNRFERISEEMMMEEKS